jgi:ribonuclease P protein component
VLSSPNKLSNARLGLAVSRRVEKRAVGRNRIKRIAREVFRRDVDLPPLDMVVLANRAAPGGGNAMLRDSLERHFRRLGKRAR